MAKPYDPANIQLSPVTEADRSFFRTAHHVAYRSIIESMFEWDEALQDEAADCEFNERNPHIIKFDDTSIGVVGWELRDDHLWLAPIYILPAFQNLGIGSLLVKRFINEAGEKGVPVRLRTLRLNEAAKRLYERLGFRVISATDIHWHMECHAQSD